LSSRLLAPSQPAAPEAVRQHAGRRSLLLAPTLRLLRRRHLGQPPGRRL